MLISTCVSEYLNHLELNKVLSFNSLRLYKRDLMDFEEFAIANYGVNFDITKLDEVILDSFAQAIINQKKSTATVNRKLTALHGMWIWLRDQGTVSRDPFTQIHRDPQFRNKTVKTLTEDEVVMLLDHPDHDLKTKMILELIYATGIRVGEITKLTVVDIDLENNIITIPRSSRFKERTIPFNELLSEFLVDYIRLNQLNKDSKLILNKRCEAVSEREIFRIIREAAYDSGINKKVTPSVLRNSFLKHMKDNGAHETLLRDITGQKGVKL